MSSETKFGCTSVFVANTNMVTKRAKWHLAREARRLALLRKSDALNSAAKIFGSKDDALFLYGIFLSLDPKKSQ